MDKCYRGDRRSDVDRRVNRRFTLKSLFVWGKREEIRRLDDKGKIFLADRYSTTIFAAIVLILFFSVIDGLLTLILLGHGAKEINPLMAYLLEIEPMLFMTVGYIFDIQKRFPSENQNIFKHVVFYFYLYFCDCYYVGAIFALSYCAF